MTKNKYNILDRNFYCHWGEIDIIAKKNNIINFFEVKTRIGDRYGSPYEAITYHKIHDLKRAINYYLLKNQLFRFKLSFKIVSVILNFDYSLNQLKIYEGPEMG